MQETRLTPTSFIVLGLLDLAGESTPYDLKQAVAGSLGNFWSLQHAQLYSEPQRLADAGYLSERREEGGRRRRHYSLTDEGRRALDEWRSEPAERLSELRDLGLLKLFFGADPGQVADAQLEMHERKLAEFEEIQRADPGGEPRGPWLTLEAGIAHERQSIEFWTGLRDRRFSSNA